MRGSKRVGGGAELSSAYYICHAKALISVRRFNGSFSTILRGEKVS